MKVTLLILISLVLCISFSVADETTGAHHVSPETKLATQRALFVVKQGVTTDGRVAILASSDTHVVAVHRMVQNRLRNLRVWQEKSPDGWSTLFVVEQFRPRQTFEVRVAQHVSPETLQLKWTSRTAFMFCGTNSAHQLMLYEIDVHALTIRSLVTELSRCPIRSTMRLSTDEYDTLI